MFYILNPIILLISLSRIKEVGIIKLVFAYYLNRPLR
jgi:hypothetical protein